MIMESVGYCVRVDALEGYGERITMLRNCVDYHSIAAIRHNGDSKDNPHYHMVIRTQVKGQAFRVRMRKVFPEGKGNGHISIKAWDGSADAVSYLFHEDPDAPLHLAHNLTDEYVAACRARNSAVKEQIEASKERASWKLEEEVYRYYVQKLVRNPDERDVAVQVMLTAWRNNKYAPNDFLLKAIVNKILYRLCDGDVEDEERLALNLVNKIYRY